MSIDDMFDYAPHITTTMHVFIMSTCAKIKYHDVGALSPGA
jgi:hypothetical protein